MHVGVFPLFRTLPPLLFKSNEGRLKFLPSSRARQLSGVVGDVPIPTVTVRYVVGDLISATIVSCMQWLIRHAVHTLASLSSTFLRVHFSHRGR